MADRYWHNRDRYGRDERGPIERAGDEVRSWFGDDDAERRRRMDEQERARWEQQSPRRFDEDRERWESGPRWGGERSYSSDRDYGDKGYGWRGEHREYGWSGAERDYGWRNDPRWQSGSQAYSRPEGSTSRYTGADYGPEGYGGPYGRYRAGAREWSSTEGWRVAGPYVGRGPRGYQRSDERIREEINDRLTAHGLIDATDVECRVANGEVTLTGFVNSREAKRAAEDLAEDISGVRQVHNQLRIRTNSPEHEGVGRTSVLGLTETQTQTSGSAAGTTAEHGRSRTR